ncbi:MAG: EAL domain-containing protein [Mycobacteriales bacterium]
MGWLSDRFAAGARMFAAFAVLSLLPVLALGLTLAVQYRADVKSRGIAAGSDQADVMARVLSETQLEGHDLSTGLNQAEADRLAVFAADEARSGHVRRLRLRDRTQRVVFADDASDVNAEPDDEVEEALDGERVALITRLNSDYGDTAPAGERVVEVYTALRSSQTGQAIGVLEVYLPYAAIENGLHAGLVRLYLTLAVGLVLLYLVLAGLALWVTRRLSRVAAQYQHLALHDPLTDLPNRALFGDRIAAAVAASRRHGTVAAVVLLDLDRFKEVNDTLGHHNGDILLRCVANRLLGAVRDIDTVARLGGDEFGLVLSGAGTPAQVAALLARITEAIEGEMELAGLPLSVEASMGVVFIPQDGETPEDLLQHADVAMYVAKRAQTGVVYYDCAQDDYNADRLSLVAELRRAFDRDELVLHYQPQVKQPTGQVDTVEALVRWQHPTRGLLDPDEFVPIAEQTGLIEPLTQWVFDAALKQLKIWHEVAPELVVAVNISARSLQRNDFPLMATDALARAGCRPEHLLLEITETALVTDAVRAAEVLHLLHAAGLRLSLDDFGQGYTSLGQLRHLPVSELKIDKTFVMNMLRNSSDAAIVRSVVELGHNLGMHVVAEGVETAEALASLLTLRCDVTQGYFFSRPMPACEVGPWLAAHALATEEPVLA